MNDDDKMRTTHPLEQSTIASRSSANARSLNSSVYSFESFKHYPEEGTYQVLFDPDAIAPSEAVVGVISEAEDIDPLDVEQLGTKTNAGALDSLIADRRSFEGDVHVSFTLHDYDVSLSSYGSLVVRPHASDRR